MRTALWGILAAVLVHLTAVMALRAPRVQPRMLAAGAGALQLLEIQYHRPGDRFLPVYAQLFQAFDPRTEVVVVVSDDEDQRQFEAARAGWFPAGDGPAVRYVQTGHVITSWARDRLAVLDDHLLAPAEPMTGSEPRARDWLVPWTVGEALGRPVRSARFRFEGGDLIADEAHVFVANPLFGRNPELPREVLTAEVARATGLDVVDLGRTGPVPEHHIGMFVTPLGDGRVMVADPTLAPVGDRVVAGRPVPVDTTVAGRFARVRDELTAAGFEVVGLPVVPSTTPYVWLSYNNVLMERRSDGLHVYLPVYGVPLDHVATQIWRDQGATVHPIDVSGLFRLGGTVRCLTAPLGYGDAQPL